MHVFLCCFHLSYLLKVFVVVAGVSGNSVDGEETESVPSTCRERMYAAPLLNPR